MAMNSFQSFSLSQAKLVAYNGKEITDLIKLLLAKGAMSFNWSYVSQ